MTRWKLTLAALLLASTPLAAQEHPYVNRGFDPEKLYQFGEIDQVDLQGGGLSITLPIGQRYPVSEKLSYGLSLVYSSKVWDYAGGAPGTLRAVPNRLSNAGMSWRVSFGELFAPGDPLNPTQGRTGNWCVVTPDGGVHELWSELHQSDPDSHINPFVKYSRDGSYLRLKLSSPVTTHTVEFPDGTIHTFEPDPNSPTGTAFRLKEIRDRYGLPGSPESWVRVAYEDPNPTTRRWRITDARGREHVVHFVKVVHDPPANAPTTPNVFMIDRIELAAFDDATVGTDGVATYHFQYEANDPENNQLYRDCKDNDSHPDSGEFLTAARLSTVALPDLTPLDPNDNPLRWNFTYFNDSNTTTCRRGQIKTAQYPTGAKIRYDYQNIFLPGEEPCPEVDPLGTTTLAIQKRQIDLNGIDEPTTDGTWYYGYELSDYPGPSTSQYPCKENEPDDPAIFPTEEQKVTVTTPLGDRTEHFFSVWSALTVSPNGFLQREFGLPFTRMAPAQPDGTRLSSRTFECAGTTCPPDHDREQYVLYESDNNTTSPAWLPMLTQQNRRVLKSRTVYRDDEPGNPVVPRYASVENSDFDGLGHYRRSKTNGDFDGSNVRESYTRFNDARGTYPGSFTPVPVATEWILDMRLYSDVMEDQNGNGTATGTEISRQELKFEPSTGFLQCARTFRNGITRDQKDLIVKYDRDAAGNVDREYYYGGDVPQGAGNVWLPTGSNDCTAVGSRQPDYTIDHVLTYNAGPPATVSKTSEYLGLTTSFKITDVVLDRNTYLPKTSRDSATIPTFFKYDPMGRVTEIRPGVGAGVTRDAWTLLTYDDTYPLDVYIERCTPGQACTGVNTLSEEYVEFDAFGRIWHEGRKIEDGYWNYRATLYDDMHHKRRQSNWITEPASPNDETIPGTQYLGYDAYGRPASIVLADGKTTSFTYFGDRWTGTTQSIGLGLGGGELGVTRWEGRDRHGRLLRVEEASGSSGLPGTNYYYDENNRLSRACQIGPLSGVGCKQNRYFSYDNRGFLLSEQHPEKGPTNGNGTVTYSLYDSRGHAGQRIDGDASRTLNFAFDKAERLLTVKDASAVTWKSFSYDSGLGAGLGKVASAFRRNVLTTPTTFVYGVTETYDYLGRGGRPSKRATQLAIDGVANERWEVSATYEELGGTNSISYPRCFDAVCGDGSGTPARTQSFTFAEGLLRSVPGWTSSITYHPSLMVNAVPHSNGLTETIAINGTTLMARPQSITASFTGGSWATGTYTYDGAGNIKTIGVDQFKYDGVSRLLEGNLASLSPVKNQKYEFDDVGNLTKITTGTTIENILVQGGASAPINRIATPAAYDAAGNLTGWNGNSYGFDLFNSMKSLTTSTDVWHYVYTADDERLLTVSPDFSKRHWTVRGFGAQLLTRETQELGFLGWTRVPTDYVWRGDKLVGSNVIGQAAIHYALDHLGTIRLITNAPGNEVSRHTYFPFGREATPLTSADPMKYTGHERDLQSTPTNPADDLDYMHARFFSPITGRFLKVDPAGGNPGKPLSWNRYSYVVGNPLVFTDPTGETTAAQIAREGEQQINSVEGHIESTIGEGAWTVVKALYPLAGLSFDGARVVVDAFKAGDSTGTAIGSEAGIGETSLAIVRDVGRTLSLLAPAAALSRSAVATSTSVAIAPRAGSAGGPGAGKVFSRSTRDATRARDANTCVFCGKETTRTPGSSQSNIDHAWPRSRGGNNTLDNAQNTCRTCNIDKRARTTDEYLAAGDN